MGTVTVTADNPQDFQRMGHLDSIRGTITMSNSYATGGDTITPLQLGFGEIDMMVVETVTPGGYVVSPVMLPNSNSYKIQIFETGAALSGPLAEVGSGTDLHLQTFRFWALGI